MTNPIDQWNRMASANTVQRRVAEKDEQAAAAAKAAKSAAPAPAPAPAASDQLQLSAVAQQASAEPAFDRAKFEAIKEAVQNGNYPLDPRRMAESFLAIEQMIRE